MKISTKTIAFTGLFTAIVYATTLIAVPNGFGGNVNFGDTFILLCAALMNPFSAMLAGGIGACLADVTLGYAAYAPFTLLVKALVGLFAGFAFKFLKLKLAKCKADDGAESGVGVPQATGYDKKYVVLAILTFILSELIMVAGYFFVNLLLNNGEFALAIAQVPFDCIQLAVSVVLAPLLLFVARLDRLFKRIYTDNMD